MKNVSMILSLITLTVAQSAFAASTGNLTLSGTVAEVNDIVVTANGSNNTSLSIMAGETAKNVASVAETSNDALGYKIYMYSSNGGQLRHSVDAAKKTTYTISYGGASYVAPGLLASPVQVKSVTSLAALTTNTSAVLINVAAYAAAVAGTYSDTVTFSIVNN